MAVTSIRPCETLRAQRAEACTLVSRPRHARRAAWPREAAIGAILALVIAAAICLMSKRPWPPAIATALTLAVLLAGGGCVGWIARGCSLWRKRGAVTVGAGQQWHSGAIADIVGVDRTVHEPVRLAIMTILAANGDQETDFGSLAAMLGASKGNLASHMERLLGEGYAEAKKEFRGKRPHTSYRLTPLGQRRLMEYWRVVRCVAPVECE